MNTTPFGDYALLIDTDSCSIEISPAVDKLFGTLDIEWNDEQVSKLCDYLDNNLTKKLNEHCKKYCSEAFLTDFCTIEFKREKCARVGYFLQKKNYSVLVYDSEGVRQKKWSHTGNVLKRSSTPKKLKEQMKYLVEECSIKNFTQADFSNFCHKLYEDMKTWDILDFSKACGYSTEKEFSKDFDPTGVTSSTAIAANYYNNLIKYLKIEHENHPIKVGDKFRMVYVKPDNKWHMNYIGFLDKFPPQFYDYLEIDYKTNFEKFFLKPLEHYFNILKWKQPEIGKEVLFDLDSI